MLSRGQAPRLPRWREASLLPRADWLEISRAFACLPWASCSTLPRLPSYHPGATPARSACQRPDLIGHCQETVRTRRGETKATPLPIPSLVASPPSGSQLLPGALLQLQASLGTEGAVPREVGINSRHCHSGALPHCWPFHFSWLHGFAGSPGAGSLPLSLSLLCLSIEYAETQPRVDEVMQGGPSEGSRKHDPKGRKGGPDLCLPASKEAATPLRGSWGTWTRPPTLSHHHMLPPFSYLTTQAPPAWASSRSLFSMFKGHTM